MSEAGMGPAIPVVHAITDDLVLANPAFLRRAGAVMGALGPRGAIHLRGRIFTAARLYFLATALAEAQERTGCWLVVNDRVDLALASGAAGTQLTSRSLTVADARAIAPSLAIGSSIHDPDEARRARDAGADWVVAGHVFLTASHPGEEGRGAEFLATVRDAANLPVIAIGGIHPEHVLALRSQGAHGVAAISGIWGAAHPEQAATDYLSAYDRDAGAPA